MNGMTYDEARDKKAIESPKLSSYGLFLTKHKTYSPRAFQIMLLNALDDLSCKGKETPDVIYSRLFEGSCLTIKFRGFNKIGDIPDVRVLMEAPLHTLTWEDGTIHVKSCWGAHSKPVATDTELLNWSPNQKGAC